MIKCTVSNAIHKNIPEMCEVLQKSQQDSFLLQFLPLSYSSYLLNRELTGLNIESIPIFLPDRQASLKAKPDDLIDFPN